MKTRSCIASLACLAALALSGAAQAAPAERPAPAATHALAPTTLALTKPLAPASGPSAHSSSIGGDVAGAFAAKLATSGASYLIGQLQGGALGGTGKSIGDFLSKIGLGDPNEAVLAEFKAVNERLDALKADVVDVGNKIDKLSTDHANGLYSTHVALANQLRSAVLTGAELLERIARAPVAEREQLAAELVAFYERRLANHELEFENYLTGGGVHGADGIIRLAAKRGQAAAQPFYTSTMSEFPRTVAADYTMLQATWLQLQLNVMTYKGASHERLREAIEVAQARVDRVWRMLAPQQVFPNQVLDTRTHMMWTWKVNATPCSDLPENATNGQVNTCIYDRGPYPSRTPYRGDFGLASVWATNGGGLWKPASVAELQGLRHGAQGDAPHWLHTRGGFPAALTGEVWTNQTNGGNATTFNQSNGATASRPMTESHAWLVSDPTLIAWYLLP